MALLSNQSDDLTWLLIRDWNSFIVKRTHQGIRTLSSEPGNLLNRHSPRYSGLAHSKPVTIQQGKTGKGVHVSTRGAKASHNSVKSARRDQSLRPAGNSRSSIRSASKATGEYRPDLHKAVLGRTSQLLRSQNPPKKQKSHKPRGKKAVQAAAAPAAAEE